MEHSRSRRNGNIRH